MAASDAAPSSLATDPILYHEYMASLVPPTKERFHEIAQIQMEKESENRRKMKEQQRLSTDPTLLPEDQQGQDAAARVIQKTFRGYRARREMDGYSINPSTRWVAAVRDAQFRETHRPRPRALSEAASVAGEARPPSASARHNWRKAGMVAFRAGRDASDGESDSDLGSPDSPDAASPEATAAKRQQRQVENAKRRAEARTMGLQYFLEMIDAKHRYGSNLRIYHEEWKRSDAQENFLYWLDYGAGRNVELDACPREQLEREQVRYLSREERQYYLVKVDAEGRLCWAKNGARIDTTEQFKDSIHGIVPADDTTPAFRPSANPLAGTSGSDSDSSIESRREADRANKYATPEFDNASGVKKIHHLSTSTIINKLLRKSVRPNCWIFVADTNFRLYVGIKDSGAFQHSSFLQGGRISAAGLIKIKNGRLQSLSPLSGHYRPPSSNFRAFLQSLKAENVDMGHLTVSKSYAVLVGLEAYVKTTKKSKNFVNKLLRTRDKAADTKPAQMAMKKLSITREK
ncbi:IQ domain-containing protein IQM1 [Beauveria bassiana]|nr:IQ domain-containing protein IQM1 [Beauveria bassiana]KAH8718829.1 IQ domain-containing protein IQM1 [Beauveria bassiana]